MRILMAILAMSLLAACTTPADRAARAQHEMENMMQEFGPACDKLGYAHDTDPWRNCVLKLGTDSTRSPVSTTCFRGGAGIVHCDSF